MLRASLSQACQRGKIDALKQLLDMAPNPSEAVKQAILPACASGNIDAVKAVLSRRADLNAATDENGTTPLLAACDEGEVKMVRWLLKQRCAPATAARNGATALMASALRGSTELCEVLLTARASVNQGASQGWTAIMSACQAGYAEVARLLLDAGAEFEHAGPDGDTARQLATKNGHQEIVKLLDTRSQLIRRRGNAARQGNTVAGGTCAEDTRDLEDLLRDLGETSAKGSQKSRGKKKSGLQETTAVADAVDAAVDPKAASGSSSRKSHGKSVQELEPHADVVEATVDPKITSGSSSKKSRAKNASAAQETPEVRPSTRTGVADGSKAQAMRARLLEISKVRADLDAEELRIRRELNALTGNAEG